MLISGRQAGRLLRDVVSSDEQARILLRAGLAGPGTRTSHGRLFDSSTVEALRLRPLVDEAELAVVCPKGLVVARLPRDAELSLAGSWSDVAAQVTATVSRQRPPTTMTSALLGVQVEVFGPMPFVATLLGFVVLAADLLGMSRAGLELRHPGPWATVVERRRLHTRPGGRPSYLGTSSR